MTTIECYNTHTHTHIHTHTYIYTYFFLPNIIYIYIYIYWLIQSFSIAYLILRFVYWNIKNWIDSFQRHVNPSRDILCQEVRETHMLYVPINIFELLFLIVFVFLFISLFLCCFFFLFYTVQSNINNSWTDLFDPLIKVCHVQPLRVRVDLGVMAMKEYFLLLRSPELESHH